ncbi:MAG TPA: TetR/AcrR family transcriptional regulator C-terminal domain-containing protein [Streptosporangiaceae bacterium]
MRSSVWVRERRRPARETLSRAQVVRAAVELLDEEGLAGLSMRKLADRLSAGATSIYWHVETKDDLLEYAIDEIYGEVDVPDPQLAGWRSGVTLFAHSLRATILRHPWFSEVASSRISIGPNAMSLSKRAGVLFRAAGFTGFELDHAQSALVSYVLGNAGSQAAWLATVKASGKTVTEWSEDAYEQVLQAADDDYPELRQRIAVWRSADPLQALEAAFTFGLECLLDGFEGRL